MCSKAVFCSFFVAFAGAMRAVKTIPRLLTLLLTVSMKILLRTIAITLIAFTARGADLVPYIAMPVGIAMP